MPQIPEKSWFKIGEVERIVDVRQHTLRAWEKEFSELRPEKSPSGQRIYSRRDVEVLLVVKSLTMDRGFTIDGARRELVHFEALRDQLLGSSPGMSTASTRKAAPRRKAGPEVAPAPPASQAVLAGLRMDDDSGPTVSSPATEPVSATPVVAREVSMESVADPASSVDMDAQVRLSAHLSAALAREEVSRKEAEGRVAELQSLIEQLRSEVTAMGTRIAAAEAEAVETRELLDAEKRASEVANHKIRALESAADTLRERAVNARAELDALRARARGHWTALVDEVSTWTR